MDDTLPKPLLKEVWITENNHRHRVYRGRTPEHVQWKLNHYSRCNPEVIVIPEDQAGSGRAPSRPLPPA